MHSPPHSSPTPPASSTGSASKSSTPPLRPQKKSNAAQVQIIADLPVARKEALATFIEIPDNNYQYKTLGRSRELLESMTCDCTYEHGIDPEHNACGPDSNCINRLTQVECLPDDCKCRNYCCNQRFQNKQYANIEIVQTEKKGFGLRVEEDLHKDTFIYEYMGDVVNLVSFKKRMRDYAQEGIQHFYFMMLQKDEFIDATKNGGIGRFANHSCNPNCYVAKWTIGDKVRMGIFAKRLIRKHEELTFNYNVDRYGHQAQVCYCGEPNCVGYIGGKTQTEFAAMDEVTLDALGITDEEELMELKGTKKKKGKKIDDPDFKPTPKLIGEDDVPHILQAIRQATSRKVLHKILSRIKMVDDQGVFRELMRLRGYSAMRNILKDFKEDSDIVLLALQCMDQWPLLNKNKVEDSQVYIPVEEFMNSEDDRIRPLAQKLHEHWNTLPTYTRIPKRLISALDNTVPILFNKEEENQEEEEEDEYIRREKEIKRARIMEEQAIARRVQERVQAVAAATQRTIILQQQQQSSTSSSSLSLTNSSSTLTSSSTVMKIDDPKVRLRKHIEEQQKIQAIITFAAEAKAAEEAAAAAEAAEKKAKAEVANNHAAAKKKQKERERERGKGGGGGGKRLTAEEKALKEVKKEKRLVKVVGEIVVKCMSKHSNQLGKESFKKYARELTHLIADKEKKSAHYKENRYDTLPEAKTTKIKRYCKEYIEKLLVKLETSGKLNKEQHQQHSSSSGVSRSNTESTSASASTSTTTTTRTMTMTMAMAMAKMNGGSNGTPSTSITTPNSADGGPHNGYSFDGYGDDQDGDGEGMNMAMEVGMDMNMELDDEDEDDDEGEDEDGENEHEHERSDEHDREVQNRDKGGYSPIPEPEPEPEPKLEPLVLVPRSREEDRDKSEGDGSRWRRERENEYKRRGGEDEYGRSRGGVGGQDDYGRRGGREDDYGRRRGREDEYGRRRDRDDDSNGYGGYGYGHGDIGDPRKRQRTGINDDNNRVRERERDYRSYSRLPPPPGPPQQQHPQHPQHPQQLQPPSAPKFMTSSSSIPSSRWGNPPEWK